MSVWVCNVSCHRHKKKRLEISIFIATFRERNNLPDTLVQTMGHILCIVQTHLQRVHFF